MPALEQIAPSCPREAADALLALGEAHLARGDRGAAAAAFDRLDREHPGLAPRRGRRGPASRASPATCPPRTRDERARLLLERGQALLAAGRTAEAIVALRAVPLASLGRAEADLARVRLGRALLARGRARRAARSSRRSPPTPPTLPRPPSCSRATGPAARGTPDAFEAVADRFPGTPWAEEALLSLANHYQKDALDDAALPWWRRLVDRVPARPLRRAGGLARGLGRLPRAPLRGRRAGLRDDRAPAPAERLDRRLPLLVGARAHGDGPGRPRAAAARGDGPALQARLPRRPRAGRPSPASAGPGAAGGARGRRAAPGGAAPRAARDPPAPAAARRAARRGGAGAAPPARVPARPGHARLDRLAPGALPPRHRRHEARLPRVGRRGRRPAPGRGLAHPLPAPLRRRAAARGPAGGRRPRARRRAHPPGVELRPGGAQPRRGARPDAGDARRPAGGSRATRASASAGPPSTTRRRASTSAPTTCAR